MSSVVVTSSRAHSADECLSAVATVRSIGPGGTAELEFVEASRCAGCAGACTWSRSDLPRRVRLRVSTPLEPGALVRMSLPAGQVLKGALLLHGVPLAALLGGAAVGAATTQSDLGTLAGALAGLAATLAGMRPLCRRAEALTLARAKLEPLP